LNHYTRCYEAVEDVNHGLLLLASGLMLSACFRPVSQQPVVTNPPLGARIEASSANDFVESIGVNTHVNYGDSAYGNVQGLLKPSLAYLGIRHIRDGLADDQFTLEPLRDLHSNGIGITGIVPYETDSMPALIANIKGQRDVLEALEGPNETDLFTQFNYKGKGFPDGTVAFMKDFYPAVKSDPQLRDLPVLQTTLAFPDADASSGIRADLLGDLSAYADYGNSHNYFSFGEPPSDRIREDHLPLNLRITPGKPMMSSEGGYQMGDGDGYKGTWNDGLSAPFDENVHGRYLMRYTLEQYRLGYKRSFIYELFDSDQPQWGLFESDGTPRLAARGLRGMIQLLSEGQWDGSAKRWQVPSLNPGALSYSLSTAPASVHTLLFQKSDGRFYLVLWNEVNNWDVTTAKPIAQKPVPLTLNVTQKVKVIRTFLPLTNGTAVTATFDSSTVQLSVPDHPLIVEIDLQY
jgi:serralysin